MAKVAILLLVISSVGCTTASPAPGDRRDAGATTVTAQGPVTNAPNGATSPATDAAPEPGARPGAPTSSTVPPKHPVLVVAEPIPAGTTAEDAVARGLVVVDAIPERFVPASAVPDLDALRGRTFARDLVTNQVVVDEMLTP